MYVVCNISYNFVSFFFFFFFSRIEVVYLFIKEMPAICPVILDSLAVFWQQIWFAVFLIPISS